MERLNFHHLLYFWVVAREGGLVPAGKVLRLSHPTISAQIRSLEHQLGQKLFRKVGRKLELTDVGRTAFRYADEIFSLGRELVDVVKGNATGQLARLEVGIADVVPKSIVRRLLQPALELDEPVRLLCHEGAFESLLADLALQQLDLVIADAPLPPGGNIRAFNHLLGETAVSWFGARSLARRYRRGFPGSLDGAPFLLPLENLSLRRSLDAWFESQRIRPRIIAEFADSALLKAFGSDGAGIFPAPSAVADEVAHQYGVQSLGEVTDVTERFYAISVEKRLKNPAALAICNAARHELFSA